MKDNNNPSNQITPRENFLMTLLSKAIKEYKALLKHIREIKPYKIIGINKLSSIPGETEFEIQVTNKSIVFCLSAAKIIQDGYHLDDFNDFHAEMIKQACQGKLLAFLKITEQEPSYKIISKRLDRESQAYIFTLETSNKQRIIRTAEEIAKDKKILQNLGVNDIYDIGYTHGTESVWKEKMALLLARKHTNNDS